MGTEIFRNEVSKLTHGVLQHYKMTRWSLSDVMAQSLAALSLRADSEQVKFIQQGTWHDIWSEIN